MKGARHLNKDIKVVNPGIVSFALEVASAATAIVVEETVTVVAAGSIGLAEESIAPVIWVEPNRI